MSRFAGEIFLEIKEGAAEYDSPTIIGETPYLDDDLDEREVIYDIEHSKKRKKLSDGVYLAFFIGKYEYIESYSFEDGSTDCSLEYHFTFLSITRIL